MTHDPLWLHITVKYKYPRNCKTPLRLHTATISPICPVSFSVVVARRELNINWNLISVELMMSGVICEVLGMFGTFAWRPAAIPHPDAITSSSWSSPRDTGDGVGVPRAFIQSLFTQHRSLFSRWRSQVMLLLLLPVQRHRSCYVRITADSRCCAV